MTQLDSYQEPCAKCQKKYKDLENWTPCKNCPWITPPEPNLKKEKFSSEEKICLECQENINFLEPEKDKYLCGKVKCLRGYIKRKSKD